jgi:hypothetical protein
VDPEAPALQFSERLDPIEGWRAWRLVRLPGGGVGLGSLFSPEERWPTRRATRAVCAVEASYHAAPAVDCRCGYYAYAERDRLAGASRRAAVIGSVAMWGSVVGHDFGFRGEFAYPQRLRLVCGRCLRTGRDRAARWVIERREEMSATCAFHAPRLLRGARVAAEDVERRLLDAYAVDVLPPTGLEAPPAWRRFGRGLRVFLGAKTSIGWLLVAVLVACVAFWGAGPTGDGATVAPPGGASNEIASGPGAGSAGHRFDDPGAGVVIRETCGAGRVSSIEVVPCSKPHDWTSSAIFHAGVVPKCFGAIIQTRPDGRSLCWIPVRAPSG